ncbi:hypothetical protein GCM10010095_21090 [Streptomyces anthocyanicus]|nr:hypothetical protein GCM10010095_21090 [Streptomyces anthocyanicus]
MSPTASSSATGPSTFSPASSRAGPPDYVCEFNGALAPWRREPAVREFIHPTRKELGVAA